MLVFLIFISKFNFAAVDSQLLRQLDIQRGLFADEYKSMELDGKQYLYVLQENTTPITRGVAVLIAEAGVSLLSQQGLAPLAANLNDLGWTTVLLSAPDTAFYPLVTPESGSENETQTSAETATDANTDQATLAEPSDTPAITPPHSKTAENGFDPKVFEKQQEELINLLKVGVQKVEEYPGFYLVISQGTSAAWLTKIFAEAKSNIPDAFIAVSPFWPDRNYNRNIPLLMAKNPMPVLDIYSASDNYWALATPKFRQTAAVKGLKLHYRQRQLLGTAPAPQKASYMAKEIYGWLSNMGW